MRAIQFHDRPFYVISLNHYSEYVLKLIRDPDVLSIVYPRTVTDAAAGSISNMENDAIRPRLIGSVDLFSDNADSFDVRMRSTFLERLY